MGPVRTPATDETANHEAKHVSTASKGNLVMVMTMLVVVLVVVMVLVMVMEMVMMQYVDGWMDLRVG